MLLPDGGCRGDNYVQPPKKQPKVLNTSNNFVQGWMKKGTWQDIGGEQCYVTGDARCPTAILVLPDMFPLQGSEVFQVGANRVVEKHGVACSCQYV